MRSVLNPTISEVVASAHYRPAISLIIPFDPKMNGHAALTIALKNACRKIEKQLLLEYPADTVVLMMEKLSTIIAQLNYNTHKKSIAIFVSPVFEKVIYLDILVEEKIAIDDSFEIRDLLYSKKQLHKYLLLQLSAGQVRMFIGNSSSFVKIVSHAEMPQQLPARDLPERVGKFSDVHAAHEKQLDKFLRQVEDSLELILRAYPLPLYIIGPEKLLGHFKKMTAHNGEVIEYIYGDYQHVSEKELSEILAPHVADWKSVLEKDIRNKMEQALSAGRMVSGIEEVWKEAHRGQGQLLLVEKDFRSLPLNDARSKGAGAAAQYKQFSCVRDAVDDIIENVLSNGGDVEFVSPALLQDHAHIALITYH